MRFECPDLRAAPPARQQFHDSLVLESSAPGGNPSIVDHRRGGNLLSEMTPNRKPRRRRRCQFLGVRIGYDFDNFFDDACPQNLHTYDALNRLVTMTAGLGRVTSYQYDVNGSDRYRRWQARRCRYRRDRRRGFQPKSL